MKRLIFIFLLSFLLTGCWDQKVINDLGFVLQMGLESGQNEKIELTINSPLIRPNKDTIAYVQSTTVKNIRIGQEHFRQKLPDIFVSGKMQQIMFSEELAQKGVIEYLDAFQKDPVFPLIAYIVVVDGSPKELITKITNTETISNPNLYMKDLIESNMSTSVIPETRLFGFIRDYYAVGLDPIAPMIKMVDERVQVMGSAIFSEGQMVGRIDTKQTSLLLASMNQMKPTEYEFDSISTTEGRKNSSITALLTPKKSKVQIAMVNSKPKVDIFLNFTSWITEYPLVSIDNTEIQNKLREEMSQEIEKDYKEIVDLLQSTGSDPLGIGNKIHGKYNDYWNSIDWAEAYPEIKINVSVNLEITDAGRLR